jgi:hypothetical protein
MRLGLGILALLAAAGCALASDTPDADTDDFIDMDTPPGNCSAGPTAEPCPDPGTTGSPEGGPCIDSLDCQGDNACVAPFVDGEVGDFVCSSQCIALLDESAWCLDAGACCDMEAVCSARGLCVVPEGGLDESGSGSGTADEGTTTGGSSTSEASGSTTGSGSDSGTTGVQ